MTVGERLDSLAKISVQALREALDEAKRRPTTPPELRVQALWEAQDRDPTREEALQPTTPPPEFHAQALREAQDREPTHLPPTHELHRPRPLLTPMRLRRARTTASSPPHAFRLFRGMRYELPRIQQYVGRDVKGFLHTHEFWSPNSMRIPFCPGRVADHELFPSEPMFLRFDGHGGRFDPFDWPQEFQPYRPWWLFIRHPDSAAPSEERSIAYQPAHTAWTKNHVGGNRLEEGFCTKLLSWYRALDTTVNGILSLELMTVDEAAARPQLPDEEVFWTLVTLCQYGEAIDLAYHVQSELREVEAWIDMVNFSRSTPPSNPIPDDFEYPFADDRFMGLWANDAPPETVKWLLLLGIPIFISHTYGTLEHRSAKVCSGTAGFTTRTGYVEGTDAELRLNSANNGFMHIALKNRLPIRPSNSLMHDVRFSSSLFIDTHARARLEGTPLPATLCLVKGAKTDSGRSLKPLDEVTLEEGRVKWIRPPPIAAAWTGKWDKFEMQEDGDTITMVRRGKKFRPDHEDTSVWYDRELGRELYLYDHAGPPSLVIGTQHFGEPAPRVPYHCGLNKNKRPLMKPSWMYRTRQSTKAEEGLEQEQPPPSFLPLLEELANRVGMLDIQARLENVKHARTGAVTGPSREVEPAAVSAGSLPSDVQVPAPPPVSDAMTSAAISDLPNEVIPIPNLPSVPGYPPLSPHEEPMPLELTEPSEPSTSKGKGKVVREDDEVSMGSGSAPNSPRPTPLKEIIPTGPTRTLRLRHIQADMGALVFAATLRTPLLVSARAELASVVNAQHALWVTFATIEEAERARNLLGRIALLGNDVETTIGGMQGHNGIRSLLRPMSQLDPATRTGPRTIQRWEDHQAARSGRLLAPLRGEECPVPGCLVEDLTVAVRSAGGTPAALNLVELLHDLLGAGVAVVTRGKVIDDDCRRGLLLDIVNNRTRELRSLGDPDLVVITIPAPARHPDPRCDDLNTALPPLVRHPKIIAPEPVENTPGPQASTTGNRLVENTPGLKPVSKAAASSSKSLEERLQDPAEGGKERSKRGRRSGWKNPGPERKKAMAEERLAREEAARALEERVRNLEEQLRAVTAAALTLAGRLRSPGRSIEPITLAERLEGPSTLMLTDRIAPTPVPPTLAQRLHRTPPTTLAERMGDPAILTSLLTRHGATLLQRVAGALEDDAAMGLPSDYEEFLAPGHEDAMGNDDYDVEMDYGQ
ncbi:hypothetical protein C8J57DRAFT_1515374 [Mycena rebaudengoi]|nr:hypothetical protein C8J57DRAFT_1515374 [Mycena rebaudengoi]